MNRWGPPTSDAAEAVRRFRLAKVAKELRLLLAERMESAPPAERRLVEREMKRRAKWQTHIQNIVNSAPPLTPEQRDRLAILLRP